MLWFTNGPSKKAVKFMRPEHGDLNDPAIWMVFAKSDLALAKVGKAPEIRLGTLCYHCQQAAEKAIKAVLIKCKVEFPPTHNLMDLFNLLPPPISPPPEVKNASNLSVYVLKGRYPLDFEDVETTEYETAVQMADKVIHWAEKVLK